MAEGAWRGAVNAGQAAVACPRRLVMLRRPRGWRGDDRCPARRFRFPDCNGILQSQLTVIRVVALDLDAYVSR
ncbi:hypothetical protein EMIT0158MI4_80277 [Burkholderia ambifaria]